ncbi:DNA-processing protein DprA [Mycobacteroides abscessus]|uniref:DNA processing protein DprA n=1 Tax=Mycobacteroides abscessus TaxID=36809 RepID=A0ABD7HFQ1_9MYCO|nr:DNA-processing protein DprA [Mycobacteroides abscessus]RIR12623.1 DNA processing protein DprA [Mycobacteroides abscessus]RIS01590.1 DNA processing protein DprA [Mycobacteroides abscessus]RIT26293.1 DNA processing protein DprA [Mycobacteroides abscessus]SIM08084.1 putative Rossmann fold nucleotide-binding protein involved in DNA uptake [Mycobacteroides abscessus subsp. abscessus]
MEQDYLWRVAVVMASLELLPAQPSDLTGILRDSDQFHALIDSNTGSYGSDLVEYLRGNLERARVEHWHKQIDRLIAAEIAIPILAADIPDAPTYPKRLARCWDAPPVLFSTAQIQDAARAVAIIGSRAGGDEVLADAHTLAADLAARGITIVSGLAMGVDGAAHKGALAADGYTIAVLGTGITRVFPEEHTDLAHQISQTGVLLSQFAPYAPRTRTSFLRRNHVIAGLSEISIIMAGQSRSGSRHEIEQAIGYGRPVLMWEPALANQKWACRLADDGKASFIKDAEDVRHALDGIEH